MTARRTDIALFLVVSCCSAWLLASGPWLDGQHLRSQWLPTGAAMMMFTPALGVLAVWQYRRRTWTELATVTGVGFGPRPQRTLWLGAAAWLGAPLFLWVAFGLSAALGLYHFALRTTGPQTAAATAVAAMTLGTIGTMPFAFGEEVGWRGWLLPALVTRLGTAGGLLATGVVWGLWHAPLTLFGYNYPSLGPWAALAFVGFCVPFGAILGWLRLRSGSIWPGVVAHAALNAGTGLFSVFADTGRGADPALAGLGVTGWVVLTLIAVILFAAWPIRSAPAAGRCVRTGAPPRPVAVAAGQPDRDDIRPCA